MIRALAAVSPPPSGMPELDEQQKKLALIAIGVFGGAAIVWGACQHMFVRGMENKERKTLLLFAGSAALTYGAAKLFDIDEKWWNVEKGAEAVEQAYEDWQRQQAPQKASTP